jgi:hypothetical protein
MFPWEGSRNLPGLDRMTRRRSGTNSSWLRWLIEFNLRQNPGFQRHFRLEEKIRPLGNGLFHNNYLFEASGRYLVLRLGIVRRSLRTRREAVTSLSREAKTLQALRSFDLPFIVPELICLDWECAQIGDPAYDLDLAIVTRGIRKPLGVPGGLHRLVQFYNEVAEHKISPDAVVVHETLLHLNWVAEAAAARAKGLVSACRSIGVSA